MRCATDVGGTFTDFLFLEGDRITALKLPSRPSDPGGVVVEGVGSKDLEVLLHGTTVATNAVLEGRVARTALVTTEGFQDMLEIGRQNRPSLYDLAKVKPPPVVPRERAHGVPERVGPRGEVLRPLDPSAVKALIPVLKSQGVEAVAVSLLFSFLNPSHENILGEALAPHFPVSLSHVVLGEFREYERTSTTCLDASLKPLVDAYLSRLEASLAAPVEVMQSNGGLRPASTVRGSPVEMLLSGPAGGVAAANHLARLLSLPNILTLDMGGTSTDVSAIVGGEILWTSEATVGGLPLGLPVVAIDSVGAGGGSVVWRDEGGALRVGPRSAGADPGPVAYGRGGKEVTVTDADLLSGLLRGKLLGGRLLLDVEAARAAVEALSSTLGLGHDDTLLGIRRVVHSNMLRALGLSLARRGLDPRDFVLMAYGGAGPVHAAILARELGVRHVVVPFLPGHFSAYGVLTSDRRFQLVRSILRPWADARGAAEGALRTMRTAAEEELMAQGSSLEGAIMEASADLRYSGQSFHLNMPWRDASPEAFHRLHDERFGYASPDDSVEVVNLRFAVTVPTPKPLPSPPVGCAQKAEERRVLFDGGWAPTKVLQRYSLGTGLTAVGPAIVEEEGATTVVPPGWGLRVDDLGVLHLKVD